MIVLAGYVVHRWIWPSPTWWLDLADTFALYLFLPALPLLLVGLLLRSRSILLACLLPLALFVLLYGELFLPLRSSHAGAPATLKVMTFNVEAMNGDFEDVAQTIERESPDLVAIQELTPQMAEALSASLSDEYRYQALAPRSDYSGAGVFSRLPLKTEETPVSKFWGHQAQHLLVDVRGQEIHLFNLHPYPPVLQATRRAGFPPFVIRGFSVESQIAEVAAMMDEIEEVEGPVVVLGDFNLTDQTRQYDRIARSLKDAYREAGWGFGHTFPAGHPFLGLPLPNLLIRIDYVFHSEKLIASEAHVGDNAGSDHRPVIVTLGLKPSRPDQP